MIDGKLLYYIGEKRTIGENQVESYPTKEEKRNQESLSVEGERLSELLSFEKMGRHFLIRKGRPLFLTEKFRIKVLTK